ncbi:E3 ubiquitin/ISG15 ligase TRIM25 [Xenopus laevis]|uniref:Uncharacterized protein n=2 Tax=Xenopus laevis TaxID=8355 RepID=A0A974C0S3_XENLA|nr:E3 ubiquitin/ISG15 ligase TRIM25 [Xenopus laevis]OCT64316.1 hypothetical protein XELAEV_18045419mg [Xenopus laevis]
MESVDLREELNCPICLGTYTDPVMLSCGHNFCQACIGRAFDQSEMYRCPECRAFFAERPVLQRNLKLCSIVERFLAAQSAPEEDVLCTYCESDVPAAKTCLHCDASLCSNHLRRHSKSEEHILTKPTTSLENRRCSIHKKVLEYYCRNDDSCICVSCCLAGEHSGHQKEALNVAFGKKKGDLKHILEGLYSEREETKNRVQSLQQHRKETDDKATCITERITALFRDIREQMEDLEMRVRSEINRQKMKVSLQVSEQIGQLEIKEAELTNKISHMEELCAITDPLILLRNQQDNDAWHPLSTGASKMNHVGHIDDAPISVVLHVGLKHFADVLLDLKATRLFHALETSAIVLDLKTASNNIAVSKDLKSACSTSIHQLRPDGPERFESSQVLGSYSFTSGQHYWEVDVSEAKEWIVGVVCQSMERKIIGNESFLGYNDKSWALYFQDHIGASHNNLQELVTSSIPVQSIGVYLNYEAGLLSFYQLYPVRHLHSFTTTFTEPLYPAFFLFEDCCIRVIHSQQP